MKVLPDINRFILFDITAVWFLKTDPNLWSWLEIKIQQKYQVSSLCIIKGEH